MGESRGDDKSRSVSLKRLGDVGYENASFLD